jgi:23S rRNA pseudouridine1911/1915/1917 synthase
MHPLSGEALEIVAPLHDDMAAYLQHHFDKENLHEILQPESIRSRFV